jgi:hypothetical protein
LEGVFTCIDVNEQHNIIADGIGTQILYFLHQIHFGDYIAEMGEKLMVDFYSSPFLKITRKDGNPKTISSPGVHSVGSTNLWKRLKPSTRFLTLG